MEFTADKKLASEPSRQDRGNGRYLRPFAKLPCPRARREKTECLAQRLLRELSEQYPDSELFASGIRPKHVRGFW